MDRQLQLTEIGSRSPGLRERMTRLVCMSFFRKMAELLSINLSESIKGILPGASMWRGFTMEQQLFVGWKTSKIRVPRSVFAKSVPMEESARLLLRPVQAAPARV